MAGIDDINVNFDSDDKTIKIDDNILDPINGSNLDIKNDDSLYGVDLLANKNYSSGNSDNGGYSSGEDPSSTRKEDYDFFKDKEEKEKEKESKGGDVPQLSEDKGETKNIPLDDPMVNEQKGYENGGFKPLGSMNTQEIKNEKIDLIYKFKKLEGQGIRTTMNYNMSSHLEDMRNEYLKLKKQREVDNSIKFQRKVMMAAITGIEYLNNKFDPFDIKLDGWSESINENITDYDEIFEELSEKYGGKSEMAPEIKLLMMLGGSAFMFHLTNTMFKSSIPGMDDILKQNPDLMNQFAKAAVGSIGKNENEYNPPPMRNTSHNVRPSMPMDQPPPQREEMGGPSGLDDIINQMNLKPEDIPDLDNVSLMSGDTDRKSNISGITLNI
tara:strand:+ start:35 stop:1183 length:1149 start_codon:yes stop_codon:yes gene_type:complete